MLITCIPWDYYNTQYGHLYGTCSKNSKVDEKDARELSGNGVDEEQKESFEISAHTYAKWRQPIRDKPCCQKYFFWRTVNSAKVFPLSVVVESAGALHMNQMAVPKWNKRSRLVIITPAIAELS